MIYIVIPVHNRKRFTKDCIQSLQNQTYKNHKIIIVDDGSTDGTKEMLETEFPEVIVLHGDGNLFWTKAINLGIRKALDLGAEYIFTLNNDTVATQDLLEKMMVWGERTPNSLLGALDLNFNTKKPYYGGEIINWPLAKSRYLLDELDEKARHGLHEVSLFPARGLLIPRQVFEKIGLFDEKKLPHYMADYDFTHMAIRNGFKVYCNYDAKLYTFPEEGGDYKIRKNAKNLRNYYDHLFSIKGGANLRNFTIYTFRNCPWKHIPLSLAMGYLRRLGGYWAR
jgi:GT2 family glycosyltransferase